MSIILEQLDKDGRECLVNVVGSMLLTGKCYEMAAAFHRGLGWPMVGIIHKEQIYHAGVRRPDVKFGQSFFDARGEVPSGEFGGPFGISEPVLQDVTFEDFLRFRPVDERTIVIARRYAEALWPELPWNKDGLRSRAERYLADVEKVSREHGLWILAPVPSCASWPRIVESNGDEEGYHMRPTDDSNTYVFNRQLIDQVG